MTLKVTNVSIHARHCCRANRVDRDRWHIDSRVSIHARHCCRANHPHRARPRHPHLFQSTPGIAAGRIKEKQIAAAISAVSIHARHCCRANRNRRPVGRSRCAVSIHARHCCRANHPRVRKKASVKVFQSTPGIAAGRIVTAAAAILRLRCFNPRPALLPGESAHSVLTATR